MAEHSQYIYIHTFDFFFETSQNNNWNHSIKSDLDANIIPVLPLFT